MSKKKTLLVVFSLISMAASPSIAATITGTWVAEIERITMDPGFPSGAAPDLQVGDHITYTYEVTSGDIDPSDRLGIYRISPALGLLTDFGQIVSGLPELRINPPDALDDGYDISIFQIADIDTASLGVVPPPGMDLFHGFVDFVLDDPNPTDSPTDALPLGPLDLMRFNQPGNESYFFLEFAFQSSSPPYDGASWFAEGRVLSVTHRVPEARLGSLLPLVAIAFLGCVRVHHGRHGAPEVSSPGSQPS